jgi:hypothetical protein
MPLLAFSVPTWSTMRASTGSPSAARAASRSRGRKELAVDAVQHERDTIARHAERGHLVREAAADGDDARGARQRPAELPARPGMRAL